MFVSNKTNEFTSSNIEKSCSNSIQSKSGIIKSLPIFPITPRGPLGLLYVKKISAASLLEIISSVKTLNLEQTTDLF